MGRSITVWTVVLWNLYICDALLVERLNHLVCEFFSGSLSTLLQSEYWGPLSDESTIGFYTWQILKGLKFLVSSSIWSYQSRTLSELFDLMWTVAEFSYATLYPALVVKLNFCEWIFLPAWQQDCPPRHQGCKCSCQHVQWRAENFRFWNCQETGRNSSTCIVFCWYDIQVFIDFLQPICLTEYFDFSDRVLLLSGYSGTHVVHYFVYIELLVSAFSAFTLLVGQYEWYAACENRVVGCWRGCEVQTCISPSSCHCHSVSLASGFVLLFKYRFTHIVPDKGPLNVCLSCFYFFLLRPEDDIGVS